MFNNLSKKILAILFIIIISASIITFRLIVYAKDNTGNEQYKENYIQSNSSDSNIVSLYCWEISDFNLSKLKDEVEYLKVNTLYVQKPGNTLENDRFKEIMEFAKQYDIDVFLLDSALDWLTTGDMTNVTNLIDMAYEMNKTLDYKLKGVSLDVEFYLTEEYQDADYEGQLELFRMFTENTKKCCDYANSLGLGYSMALPVWIDKLAGDELEDLINYNYDHIAFMNYYKETIMDNINEEVEFARKNNIKIVSIIELQDPRNGNVGEEDTFYNDGLQEAIDTLSNIQQKYNYEKLGISYHYYKPLLELLERDTDVGIENKYEIEVYPYINEESIKVDEATISSDDGTFQPIYGYYSDSGEYVVNFYGLEYGKEYTLTIKSGNYIGTKTFTYQKNDKDLDKLEVAYISIALEENKTEEKDPTETKPEESKPDNEKDPNETKPNENKPVEKNPGTTKNEQLEANKDTTMAQTILPQTGKDDIIEKLLIVSIIVMFSLAIINKRLSSKIRGNK